MLTIDIIEPAMFPHLYLHTDHLLGAQFTSQELQLGTISLGYEGNTTLKVVGTVYLCDLNENDKLDLMFANDDGNMTYTVTEVTGVHTEDPDEEEVFLCFKSNLRCVCVCVLGGGVCVCVCSNKSQHMHNIIL